MQFINDASAQTGGSLLLFNTFYSTKAKPSIKLNSNSGIYNPSDNVVKIFTNNIDALTIDASQYLTGNGTGLTNLNYGAISNKPTNFQTDWNTTVSNRPSLFSGSYNDLSNRPSLFSGSYNDLSSKPDLSVYATNINLNSLSTNSILILNNHTTSISNLNLTSTSLLTTLNNHTTSISNLNLTSTSLLTTLNNHTTSINNLNTTSTSIFNNLTNLSTNSTLSINGLTTALVNKQDIYTVQRQYPSKAFDSVSSETTTTFLGRTVYTASFTLNSDAATYDAGTYTCYYSLPYGSGYYPYKLVDNNLSSRAVFQANYNAANGFYSGSDYIVNDYLGHWFILKLTKPIILTKISFYWTVDIPARAPGLWKIYGSNDGATWNYISNASNITTRLTTSDYNSGIYTKTILNDSTTYLYYGLVVNQLLGNNNYLDFQEWQILGVEKISGQADWTTTIINKPDLSFYATTTNLSSLTTSLNLFSTTSTTMFNNLNSLSSSSYLSISGLTNNLNTISSASVLLINSHTTSITNLTATSNTIFTNLNSLSTNSTLSINNLNATSTTIFNSLSTYITTTNANALNSRFFNNNGNNHGNYTDFNSPTQFGYNFIGGTTNGPGVNGAGQYYSWDIGLGANYGIGTYRAQFALPRNATNPYLCVRYQENGGYSGWQKLSSAYADSAGSVAYANVTGIPDLTGYATNTNLNSLSSYSVLNIANLSATSTTILGLVNSHTTALSNLNITTSELFFGKQDKISFSGPFLNIMNTLLLKYDSKTLNVDVDGILTVLGNGPWNTTGTSIFYSGGNVGIGTIPSVYFALDVNGSANIGGLWFNGFDSMNTIFQTNRDLCMRVHAGFNMRFSAGGVDIMRMTSAGNVGIGTNNPSYRLHVAATSANTGTMNMRYFNYGASTFGYTNFADTCAYFASSLWCASWIASSSDIRIKTNIQDIVDDTALQQILNIQPKTYEYIDKVKNGDKKVYGFIAQQIKEIIPEAIALQSEVIPNIYKNGICETNKITLDCDVSNILNINDKIDIIDDNGNYKQYTILSIENNSFTIDDNIETNNVFVYGSKVNDFHTISKDYIFTLNVCATQELHKLIKQQNLIIQDLQNRLSILENKII